MNQIIKEINELCKVWDIWSYDNFKDILTKNSFKDGFFICPKTNENDYFSKNQLLNSKTLILDVSLYEILLSLNVDVAKSLSLFINYHKELHINIKDLDYDETEKYLVILFYSMLFYQRRFKNQNIRYKGNGERMTPAFVSLFGTILPYLTESNVMDMNTCFEIELSKKGMSLENAKKAIKLNTPDANNNLLNLLNSIERPYLSPKQMDQFLFKDIKLLYENSPISDRTGSMWEDYLIKNISYVEEILSKYLETSQLKVFCFDTNKKIKSKFKGKKDLSVPDFILVFAKNNSLNLMPLDATLKLKFKVKKPHQVSREDLMKTFGFLV